MIFSRNVILAGHIADLCCYRRVISKEFPANFGLKNFFQKKFFRYLNSNLVKFGGQNVCHGTRDPIKIIQNHLKWSKLDETH